MIRLTHDLVIIEYDQGDPRFDAHDQYDQGRSKFEDQSNQALGSPGKAIQPLAPPGCCTNSPPGQNKTSDL